MQFEELGHYLAVQKLNIPNNFQILSSKDLKKIIFFLETIFSSWKYFFCVFSLKLVISIMNI